MCAAPARALGFKIQPCGDIGNCATLLIHRDEERRLRGDSFLLGLLATVQEIGGALRMGGSGKDRALVAFENLQPALDIGGMIGARFRRQAKISTKESRAQLGHQFFAGVAFIAPALAAKLAIQPRLVLRPVPVMPISA